MPDIRAMLNMITKTADQERSKYHLTLGQLISALEAAPANHRVVFDDNQTCPGLLHSYRGYYSDLAFEPADAPFVTASELLVDAKDALGKTFEGYKGGDFTMTETTPLWRAFYGSCGEAMMSISEDLVITTKVVE